LAKPTAPTPTKTPVNTNRFIPKSTDARSELFFLVGRLSDVEAANRIIELFIDLTDATQPVAPVTEG
jgi:hypothetical protein